MSGDVHVQFSEGLRVKFPWSTQPFLWTREGWMYLAVVIDPASRKIVDWALSKRITKQLVIKTL